MNYSMGCSPNGETLKWSHDDLMTNLLVDQNMTNEPAALNAIVAVYDSHDDAESAVKTLEHGGFDMRKLSIVGRDYHTEEHVIGYYNAGDRIKYWGTTGAFWGGVWSILFGSAFLMIPGMGPLLAAGPIVGWIAAALEGAIVVGGMSAIGAGLFSLGIPKNSIVQYEAALKAGKFLVIAHGTEDEVKCARQTLGGTILDECETHSLRPELLPSSGNDSQNILTEKRGAIA